MAPYSTRRIGRRESAISSRLPRPAATPLPPRPAHHLASPASWRLVPHSPCDCCHFSKLGNLFSASVHRLLCSVRCWGKQISEALCPGDLNSDAGVFLPAGHSALGVTAPIRTGRSVCRIWTVPGPLRSSKCRAEARGRSSIPPHILSFLLSVGVSSFPAVALEPAWPAHPFPPHRTRSPPVRLTPSHSALLPACLAFCLSPAGLVFFSVSDYPLGINRKVLQEAGLLPGIIATR